VETGSLLARGCWQSPARRGASFHFPGL
jgi:hypothetical protein